MLIREACFKFPLETGGVLLGYRTGSDHVITNAICGGPCAVHRVNSFIPDYSFQEAEIASFYNRSNGNINYLGDWHTHPNGTPRLSRKDKATLLRISKFKDARIDEPLMGILVGSTRLWNLNLWKVESRKFAPFRKQIRKVEVRTFAANLLPKF